MRTPEGMRIFETIRTQRGAEEAISAPAICVLIGWPQKRERHVRRIIAHESCVWPEIVCSIPGEGYFIAVSCDEILNYRSWLTELRDQAEMKLSAFTKLCAAHGIHFNQVLTSDSP